MRKAKLKGEIFREIFEKRHKEITPSFYMSFNLFQKPDIKSLHAQWDIKIQKFY
jgi:cytochrome c-type biogenesis protein CcmH/NrfG